VSRSVVTFGAAMVEVDRIELDLRKHMKRQILLAQRTLEVWAKRAGMGDRTLARSICQEAGMTFDRWRQQPGVMRAAK